MSYVIASTTDTQEAVNTAAGIGTPQPEAPSEVPEQDGEPKEPAESEPADEDNPDQEAEQKAKHPNVQRRIDRLVRDKYQLSGRVQELERRLAESSATRPEPQRPAPANTPQASQGRPVESQFERYEDYIEALTDYKSAQAFHQLQAQLDKQREMQRQATQQSAWHERLEQSRATIEDFDSTLEAVEHIQLTPVLQQAILEHEHGPRLAYELARDPKVLQRMVTLSPTAALRELGRFEAKLDLNGAERKPPAISKAPPPISPVGQGSTRSTKKPEDMDYQEYKRWWAKQHGK